LGWAAAIGPWLSVLTCDMRDSLEVCGGHGNRRGRGVLLHFSSVLPADQRPQTGTPHMPRITDVRTVLLTGPCTNDPYLSESRRLRSAAFVEVHTDGGIVGLGETYAGYFCPECVPAIVEFFKPILVGQSFDVGADPRAWVSTLWDRMYLC